MLAVHVLDTDLHVFTAGERETVTAIAEAAEAEVRPRLSDLASRLNLLVVASPLVIDVTGELGVTMSPSVIEWRVDPDRGVASVAAEHLRNAFAHEASHAARLARHPGEAYCLDWYQGAVFEGLATVFQREVTGWAAPWGDYDGGAIETWAEDLFAQPVDHRFSEWKFDHADGRRWIAYRVGTWVVDRAVERSGRSAAELTAAPIEEIVVAAGLDHRPRCPI